MKTQHSQKKKKEKEKNQWKVSLRKAPRVREKLLHDDLHLPIPFTSGHTMYLKPLCQVLVCLSPGFQQMVTGSHLMTEYSGCEKS